MYVQLPYCGSSFYTWSEEQKSILFREIESCSNVIPLVSNRPAVNFLPKVNLSCFNSPDVVKFHNGNDLWSSPDSCTIHFGRLPKLTNLVWIQNLLNTWANEVIVNRFHNTSRNTWQLHNHSVRISDGWWPRDLYSRHHEVVQTRVSGVLETQEKQTLFTELATDWP